MEGLPIKLGASPTSVDHLGAAAFDSDGGNARKALHVVGRRIVRTIGAEEGRQARSQGRARARQLLKEVSLGIILEDGFDALLIILDGPVESLNKLGVQLA